MQEILNLDPEKYVTLTEFEHQFTNIANILLNEVILDINGKAHRIAEIEFYLQHNNHNDTFAHCDAQQLTHGQWYFHKTGNSYRGGTYKGLDITFSKTGYSGILIRALYDMQNNKYIDGPSLSVDHLLNQCNVSDIISLTKLDNFSWDVDEGIIAFKFVELEKKILYTSGRIGLNLKTETHIKFAMKPYRFMIYPEKVKKGKQHLILELYYQGKSSEEITNITSTNKKNVNTYISHYENSKNSLTDAKSYYGTVSKLSSKDFCKYYQVVRKEANLHV